MWTKFLLILTLVTKVIAPNPPKWVQKGHEPKIQLFLLGKVETSKYPEAETWHPESIDRNSYYRLCKHF